MGTEEYVHPVVVHTYISLCVPNANVLIRIIFVYINLFLVAKLLNNMLLHILWLHFFLRKWIPIC